MNIAESLKTLRSEVLDSGAPTPERLATALGWQSDSLGTKKVTQAGIELQTARGKIGFQSAALFASPVATTETKASTDAR